MDRIKVRDRESGRVRVIGLGTVIADLNLIYFTLINLSASTQPQSQT